MPWGNGEVGDAESSPPTIRLRLRQADHHVFGLSRASRCYGQSYETLIPIGNRTHPFSTG